jgi:hypothetical protein
MISLAKKSKAGLCGYAMQTRFHSMKKRSARGPIDAGDDLKHGEVSLKFPGVYLFAVIQPLDTFSIDKPLIY